MRRFHCTCGRLIDWLLIDAFLSWYFLILFLKSVVGLFRCTCLAFHSVMVCPCLIGENGLILLSCFAYQHELPRWETNFWCAIFLLIRVHLSENECGSGVDWWLSWPTYDRGIEMVRPTKVHCSSSPRTIWLCFLQFYSVIFRGIFIGVKTRTVLLFF